MRGDAGAATHVLPGAVVVGKYRVDRILGQGGMGVVVAAHHLQLDEKVAIKFLVQDEGPDPEADMRFLREAQAAVKIKSEHVARVTDVGRLENGLPYMVMEHLEGRDLARWLLESGKLPIEQAVDFLLQACEAVAEAHTLGIVHRDLKPANLFCIQRRDGALAIKVLDFGISKMTLPGNSGHDVTRTRTVIGSPLYISPEQLRASREVDARADIWSLGVILFELLCQKTPFESETLTDLAIKIATEPAVTLRAYRPDAPRGLEQVIERCLEKDRKRRFPNVGELASALERFGTKSSATSADRIRGTERMTAKARGQSAPSLEAQVTTGPPTNGSWGKTGPFALQRRSLVVLVVAGIAFALMAVVAVSGFLFFRATRAKVASGGEAGTIASVTADPSPAPMPAAPLLPLLPAPLASSVPAVTSAAPVASAAPALSAPALVPAPSTNPGGGAHPRPSGCTPPYTVDELGRKHFKPQCFPGR